MKITIKHAVRNVKFTRNLLSIVSSVDTLQDVLALKPECDVLCVGVMDPDDALENVQSTFWNPYVKAGDGTLIASDEFAAFFEKYMDKLANVHTTSDVFEVEADIDEDGQTSVCFIGVNDPEDQFEIADEESEGANE